MSQKIWTMDFGFFLTGWLLDFGIWTFGLWKNGLLNFGKWTFGLCILFDWLGFGLWSLENGLLDFGKMDFWTLEKWTFGYEFLQ